MNVFRQFRQIVIERIAALAEAGDVPPDLDTGRVTVEPPRESGRGDLASNAALVLAKPAGQKPPALAERLAEGLRARSDVAGVEVAGPGFLNITLTAAFWRQRLAELLHAGEAYGDSELGAGTPVNVEYVSANPTGPLHVAHARGAVVGDALARLLKKCGYRVTREYYINDAGQQVAILARSAYLRYREALGEEIGTLPEGYYPGSYLKDVGRKLAERDGAKWLDQPEEAWFEPVRAFAVEALLADIKADLGELGIAFDVFASERALVDSGAVADALAYLDAQGYLYRGTLAPPKGKQPEDWEPREQTLFHATAFGDDTDRPLRKADGSYTYFANDIAYHRDKYRRGFAEMIDVWGADHGGYVKRLEAAVRAITGGQGRLDVKICAIVNVQRAGKPVRMSKRAGDFETLGDLVEAVGKDVVRFIMLTRKNTETLDFDLERVTEHTRENPVFYVQYAHARCCSVLRHLGELFPDLDRDRASLASAELDKLTDDDDLALVKKLAEYPRVVEQAGQAHEPHRLAFYLYDTAAAFHALWNKGRDATHLRFLHSDDRALTAARVALVEGVRTVIANGLATIGVTPVEELR